MQDRHALGAARASASMQNQRDVVSAWSGRRLAGPRPGDADHSAAVHLQRVDWNTAARCSLPRGVRAFRRAEEDLGVCVLQVEAEFILPVAGIERSRCAGNGGGQEADHCRQSIRQRGRHAIASADAHRRQSVRHAADLVPKRLVGDADSRVGQQKRGAFRRRQCDQLEQGVWLGHNYNVARFPHPLPIGEFAPRLS